MRRALFLVPLLLVAACGSRGELTWPDGKAPPAPLGAAQPETAAEMLVPPPQAAPVRLDDPVERSEERREDRFDLPPSN